MGINNKRAPQGYIDADIAYVDGPYGSGSISTCVRLSIEIDGEIIQFTSEPLDAPSRIAHWLDGKFVRE